MFWGIGWSTYRHKNYGLCLRLDIEELLLVINAVCWHICTSCKSNPRAKIIYVLINSRVYFNTLWCTLNVYHCRNKLLHYLYFTTSQTRLPVTSLIAASPFSHLQAVTIVDSRWDLILLPYRLVFLLLLFSRMSPFCHLIEAHGLGCETAHRGIRRQAAEFPQPLTAPHSIRMHRILTFHNLWLSRLI